MVEIWNGIGSRHTGCLCLSVVCCGTSSLPADILEDDWRWMYGCGVLSLAGLALLVLLFPKR